MSNEILYLSQADVIATGMSMKDVLGITERAFKAFAEGEAVVPAKISLDMEAAGRLRAGGTAMPAYVAPWDAAGLKWIGYNFENPEKRGLPSHTALIILNSPESMAPVAVMDGGWITAMRTGAETAAGVKHLGGDARRLAILGAGYQSGFQLRAVWEVARPEEVRIVDVRRGLSERFAEEMGSELGANISVARSIEEAVRGCDLIVAVTSAEGPIVKKPWVADARLICALGSFYNLEYAIARSARKIVVDHVEQTMEMGELAPWFRRGMLRERDVYATIGDVVVGRKPGRETREELILYVPIGMGCLDIAVAAEVYGVARRKKLGQVVPHF